MTEEELVTMLLSRMGDDDRPIMLDNPGGNPVPIDGLALTKIDGQEVIVITAVVM